MIYGTPPVNIADDQTDRLGIRTLLLSQDWKASRWPMPQAELDAEAPAVPEVPGGIWLIGKQTRPRGGGLRTLWTFEGIDGDGKSVTFKTRGNSPDYGFKPGFAEVSILLHPRIQELLDQYEGTVLDGEVIWLPTLSGSGPATGLGGSNTERPNPMFGQKGFLRIEGIYSYRYLVRDESEIPDTEGRIFSSSQLPGRAKRYSNRNWIGAGADYDRCGPAAIKVAENYWLSGEGGWPAPTYRGGAAL